MENKKTKKKKKKIQKQKITFSLKWKFMKESLDHKTHKKNSKNECFSTFEQIQKLYKDQSTNFL